MNLNYESMLDWMHDLENSGFYPDQGTIFWIENLAQGTRIEASIVKLMSTWRARRASLWTSNDHLLHNGSGDALNTEEYESAPDHLMRADIHTKMALDPDNKPNEAAQLAERVAMRLESLSNSSNLGSGVTMSNSVQSYVVRETGGLKMKDRFQQVLDGTPPEPVTDSNSESPDSPPGIFENNDGFQHGPQLPNSTHQLVSEAPMTDLTDEQNAFLITVCKWYNDRYVRSQTDTRQLQELLSGAAGTGKSYVVRKIVERLGLEKVRCLSFQGIAASLLPGGQTIHSAFSLDTRKGDKPIKRVINSGARRQKVSQSVKITAKEKFSGVVLIIVDEISNTKASLMIEMDAKLKEWNGNREPYGGLGVILMGDMFQIPPVGGCSLISPSASLIKPVEKIFSHFNFRQLTVQMRAHHEDVLHLAALDWFRNPSSTLNPIASSKMLDTIATLKRDDFRQDPSWHDATIIVSENVSRVALNKTQAFIFARRHGLPVISWRNPIYSKSTRMFTEASNGSEERLEKIFNTIGELTFYFVAGAPAVIKDNISTANGLANGRMCTLHSITLTDDDETFLENALRTAIPGQEIRILNPPVSVNVEIENACDFLVKTSIVTQKTVIPMILRKQIPRDISLANDVAAKYSKDVKEMQLKYVDHGLDLAFALTYHKVQGRTLRKVIIDLNVTQSVTVAAFYVAVSRVSRQRDIRILEMFNSAGREQLKAKMFDHRLVDWWCLKTNQKPFEPKGGKKKPVIEKAIAEAESDIESVTEENEGIRSSQSSSVDAMSVDQDQTQDQDL